MPLRGITSILLLLLVCPERSWASGDKTSAAAAEKMKAAILSTSLDAADMRPWHWKMDVTYSDSDGKPSASGTIEAWYADGNMRTVMTSGSGVLTTLRIGNQIYRDGGDATKFAPFEIAFMEALHPIPDGLLNPETKLTLVSHKVGQTTLDCVEVSSALPPPNVILTGAPLSYCLMAPDQFVAAYQPPRVSIARLQRGVFQGKQAPLEIAVTVLGKKRLEIKTDELKGFIPEADTFTVGSDLQLFDAPVDLSQPDQMLGMRLDEYPPQYPSSARARRSEGSAIFDVLIGVDGRVVSKTLAKKTDPDLAAAASQALAHWIFRPYLINGVAVQVKTTITINFNLG